MISQVHQPILFGHTTNTRSDFAIFQNLFDRSITTERIDSGVRRILQDGRDARIGEPSPNQFTSPRATVASLGKIQLFLGKTLHDAVRRAALLEVVKDQLDRRTDLCIGVFDDASSVHRTHSPPATEIAVLPCEPC